MNLDSRRFLLWLAQPVVVGLLAVAFCLLDGCSKPVVTPQLAPPVVEPSRSASSAAVSVEPTASIAPGVAKRPQIFLPETTHNFGKVKAGAEVAHVFNVINAGTAPLAIKAVRTSCGCTTAGLDRRTLEPGEASELKVTFGVGNRRGQRVKKITITSNDPNHPQTILTISADVLPTRTANSRSHPTARARSAASQAPPVRGPTVPERLSTQHEPATADRQPPEEPDPPAILRKPRP